MKSRLQIAGHPIHVMVVAMPIGLYSASLVCDFLYLILRDPFWFRMAYWAIAFGLVTHLAAIATGVPDFLAILQERSEAKRTAMSHLVFGISLLVVQGLNLGLRNGGEVPPSGSVAMPVIVNLIGAALTGLQGWYGGELVYRYRIGIEPEPALGSPARPGGKKHP